MSWELPCNIIISFIFHVNFKLVVNNFQSFNHSWLDNGFITRITRWVPLVEQELLTHPEQPSFPGFKWGSCYSIFNLCVCFVDRCLSFWQLCLFFFDLRFLITSLVFSNSSLYCFQIYRYIIGRHSPLLPKSLHLYFCLSINLYQVTGIQVSNGILLPCSSSDLNWLRRSVIKISIP